MSRDVKTRPYNSPRRQEQAAATRDAILEAARQLFAARGYGATTISAIATEAGVAVKTVYLAFETKAGILRALWNRSLRGDDKDIPVGQREWYLEVLDETDPAKQLEMNARNSVAVKERVADVVLTIRQAAPIDTEIAALWERIETEFHARQRDIVASVAKHAGLRRGLTVDRATDIVWTVNHPDTWHLLVRERGWTPQEYERWSLAIVRAELLG